METNSKQIKYTKVHLTSNKLIDTLLVSPITHPQSNQFLQQQHTHTKKTATGNQQQVHHL